MLAAVPGATTLPLVIECRTGIVKEVPAALPETIEIRIESGVMKIDLSKGEIESTITDIDIEAVSGVLKVILPHDAVVEVADHVSEGGVFKNKVRAVKVESWRPRLLVHVRNQGAVVKLTRARR